MIEKLKNITGGVVESLKEHPILMLVLILNVVGIGAAVYFLNHLLEGTQAHTKQLIEAHAKTIDAILRACGPRS